MAHGSRDGDGVVVDGENVIDPSMPPNDNPGDGAEVNGLLGGADRPPERNPPDPAFANGLDSMSVDDIALILDGIWYPRSAPYDVGMGSGSLGGQNDPSLPAKVNVGCRAGGVGVSNDAMSTSSAADTLFKERDLGIIGERPVRGLLGPATASSSSSCGVGGRSCDTRGFGVSGERGGSSIGGGADPVRCVGGAMDGGGKREAWGARISSGFVSDLANTCWIAAKSKPACTGIADDPRSPP